jgi:SAM-dependent methyltransferase
MTDHSYDPAGYGSVFAPVYDVMYPGDDHVERLVEVIGEHADGGPVLEMGVGTGRVAIPLAGRGLPVHGIDASPDMLESLQAKAPPANLTVAQATLTDAQKPGVYGAATLLAHTLFMLPDQDTQRDCLRVAYDALRPGGRLLVEAYARVPEPFAGAGSALHAVRVDAGMVVLAATAHDPARQSLLIQHIVLAGGVPALHPVLFRYAWPSEIDLLAEQAGFSLEHRWAGPGREPVTATTEVHLSIYRKPPTATKE